MFVRYLSLTPFAGYRRTNGRLGANRVDVTAGDQHGRIDRHDI